MKRRPKKPYRVRKKKSFLKNRFFWLLISFLIFFGGTFCFLLFSKFFQVEKIKIEGENKVSKEEIKLLVKNKLERKLFFFKTKSIFLVNTREIREEVLRNFPQIASLEIAREFPDSLNFLVRERLAFGLWCQNGGCFLIDNEGIIFEEISQSLPEILKIKTKDLKKNFKLGDEVIKKEEISKILEISSKLKKDLGLRPEEVLIISGERINIKTSKGWEIYFNLQKDIDWQLTKLKMVLRENYLPREYIDLRFGDRAFVK